ncbi:MULTISPECIES: AraC family transcriptional regulator [unclassified Bradyrhizobium]|uniref:helix-turn-helix transcriptional regulator n=1 Tax=unclassified Bradyrhizobium TaxID=2631580 RepID=UPI001CD780C5|nr:MULTISPECIES: AraC family transcriptional regulator [unclassified Bradyrhizobium]MCA1375521.1 helix-turn-helix transcriptional regulator [Bradyrhizobium sp. IC4060]MCA1485212.1 helix-turn-helix transcriptional regulator [Bradyrhizobium sp. IC4061]MCA1543820.1 helix-turn-helix transcriptional regulator [Bradyrhizobium sp. NBAIM32]
MQKHSDSPSPAAAQNERTVRPFDRGEVHSVLRQFDVKGQASSAGLGWSTMFASVQREEPFRGRFEANANALLVTAASGPVDVTYRIDGRVVSRHLQEKGIFFLPPRRDCEVTLDTPLDSIHVYLRPELFAGSEGQAQNSDFGLSPLLGEPEPLTHNLLAVVEEMVREGDVSCSLMADSIAHAIANRFVVLNGRKPKTSGGVERGLSTRSVRSIRDFVEANIADCIKLGDLAAICGVSPEYFIRLFKSSLGVSPHRYVVGVRIHHAKLLLTDPNIGLAEVARQCGFAHQQHFTNTFRRMTGLSPGAYRRAMN